MNYKQIRIKSQKNLPVNFFMKVVSQKHWY